MSQGKRRIAILGSTGSIGTQALKVISAHPDIFEAELLVANSNWQLLVEQAIMYRVNSVVIADESKYHLVADALHNYDIKVFTGDESVCALAAGSNIDIVLAAMVGFSGLKPTIAAIKAGKTIALANKETLVAAGSYIMNLSKEYNSPIIPVDSEHSAIFQCLQGEHSPVEKIILTASGGPFFGKSTADLKKVTVRDALNHPKWKMGPKVTVDSATMMNKGLEMIEARWIFGIDPEKIEIVVHPQSIIHSMTQFKDGSVIAQLSVPDMRIPIQYALSYPTRLELDTQRVDFTSLSRLDFHKPDYEKFPCLHLAGSAVRQGGSIPCAMNAANEVAVYAFLEGRIPFTSISNVIEHVMESACFISDPGPDSIFETDKQSRHKAEEYIKKTI